MMKTTKSATLDKQMSFSKDPQGMYICAPDGTGYGFTNDHYPVDVNKFMDACLKQYKAHPPKPVIISPFELKSEFAISAPADAAIVGSYARIRPLPEKVWGLNKGVGRDYLWIYADELQKMAAKPDAKTPIKLPADLAYRIARFHLVDSVRGTPDLWTASQVRKLTNRTVDVVDSGGFRTIKFVIEYRMSTASGKRGYEGKLEGRVKIALATAHLEEFRAYSLGKAWGDGTYTPFSPPGKFDLHVALHETNDPMGRVVPPEEVSTENHDRDYHKAVP